MKLFFIAGRRGGKRHRQKQMVARQRAELAKPPEKQNMEALELDLAEIQTGRRLAVRRDCGFCGYERTPKDDNHAPECPYWTVGPGKFAR